MKLIELDRKASYIKPKISFYNNAEELKLYKKYLFYKGIKKAFRKVDE